MSSLIERLLRSIGLTHGVKDESPTITSDRSLDNPMPAREAQDNRERP
jgi:hypothetical protein